jgi:hypothetical protein
MKFGIQKKYALTISIFLLLVFSLSSWEIVSYTSELTRENIQKQQYAMTEIIARGIDDKLGTWLATLDAAGRNVPDDIFHNQRKAQHLLDRISGSDSMFTNGFMLLDKNFKIVAERGISTLSAMSA